jgi:hypothetical protein
LLQIIDDEAGKRVAVLQVIAALLAGNGLVLIFGENKKDL